MKAPASTASSPASDAPRGAVEGSIVPPPEAAKGVCVAVPQHTLGIDECVEESDAPILLGKRDDDAAKSG